MVPWPSYLDRVVLLTKQQLVNPESDMDWQPEKMTTQISVTHDETASDYLAALLDSYVLEAVQFFWFRKI
ncbi:uncharacterized protein ACLA_096260 [Aspergillus clavatus NRRL 1]|uniref:Uncharacterized protein n=1 Tax=Aspergillus clavatus (strain ATCC 1007 / CBS 513.65 / DSM 816 / NCTC 3887 / NRRL 1 / QM 1276 / 107) TaxID=344612 RepID=A1CMA6_ASPCL|nr:uncharacterized protein ACLA_096260 [Aspergillus clavatus NRRL 1]EAW08693.1 hypothetical protein ACLA_096260 [Aspergillus clavatus NRRL 1]